MNKMIIRINHQEVVSFLLTLLTVWMSRTVFFGIVNQRITWLVYCGCILAALFLVRIPVIRFKNNDKVAGATCSFFNKYHLIFQRNEFKQHKCGVRIYCHDALRSNDGYFGRTAAICEALYSDYCRVLPYLTAMHTYRKYK